jgi:predicted HTH transcriptional regulator
MPTHVPGVGRIDLCAKHAVEAMGLAKPVQIPKEVSSPKPVRETMSLHARQILTFIAANPGTTQGEICERLGFHRTTTGAWIVKLTQRGYIRGIGQKSMPIPWKYFAIARPPGE